MRRANPEGTHSLLDFDDTMLKYLKADRKERQRMCDEILEGEGIVYGLGMLVILVDRKSVV